MNEFFAAIKRITDDYRAGAGLPPLHNQTPCDAFLQHDLSGVRMKSHISECEDCIELMDKADKDEPDQYRDGDGDEAVDHKLDSPTHTPYSNLGRK